MRETCNVAGNYYDKYHARNPVARYLMDRFLNEFDELTTVTNARTAYEVGCGEGHLSLRLLHRGLQVRGCDLDPPIARMAAETVSAIGSPAEFSARSVYDLTPDEASAELVVCCEVLEHLPDPESAIRVLTTLARPWLLVSVPREPIWRVLNVARGKYLAAAGNTPGHLQHWSTNSFIALLRRHVSIVEVRKPLPWTMALCRIDRPIDHPTHRRAPL
ncbi:MAG: class I SAM-dependent methyltransferase [Gammaproteobacteria bacterium]|nr:class I SAM-dependent methyltransferase [Gammaproteobacteria bacterium]